MSHRVRDLTRRVLICAALGSGTLASAAPAATEAAIDFVVVASDTLIGLSNTVLVSPSAWQEVARLNRLRNPNLIVPGQVLRIPTRLLRGDSIDARVISTIGDVRIGDAAAAEGSAVAENQPVQTGANGSAVIELADGSRVRVPPSSLAQVAASRRVGQRPNSSAGGDASAGTPSGAGSGWFAGTMRLVRGSLEIFAAKVLRAKPLEVVTPTAVVGVRGTQYRVAVDDSAARRTHSEVLEGVVRFDPSNGSAGADLHAGFGADVGATSEPAAVAKLLDPPDLSSVPVLFERPLVHFSVPGEATPLRVQVAADAGFEKVVNDQKVDSGGEIRVAELDDAQWYLRARRIDPHGIEGFDSVQPFTLKARPEPPAYRAPRADAKQAIGDIEFVWAPSVEAPRARLQVAEDAAFTKLVQDKDQLDASSVRAAIVTAGTYYWRLASQRANGAQGPFGDPQRFELRALPEAASSGKSADGSALVFNWSGRPGDRQRVEFARDAEFKQIVAQTELDQPEWTLPMPSRSGRYYFRYRSVEPDGFVGPYSPALVVDVPRDWSLLLIFVPALLLL